MKQFIIAFMGEQPEIEPIQNALLEKQQGIIDAAQVRIAMQNQYLDNTLAAEPDIICYCLSPASLLSLRNTTARNSFLAKHIPDTLPKAPKKIFLVNQQQTSTLEQSQNTFNTLLNDLTKATNKAKFSYAITKTAIDDIDNLWEIILNQINLKFFPKSQEKTLEQKIQVAKDFKKNSLLPKLKLLTETLEQLYLAQLNETKLKPVCENLADFVGSLIEEYRADLKDNNTVSKRKLTEINSVAEKTLTFYTTLSQQASTLTQQQLKQMANNFVANCRIPNFNERILRYASIFAATLLGIASGFAAGVVLGMSTGFLTLPVTAGAGALIGGGIGFVGSYSANKLCDRYGWFAPTQQTYLRPAIDFAVSAETSALTLSAA